VTDLVPSDFFILLPNFFNNGIYTSPRPRPLVPSLALCVLCACTRKGISQYFIGTGFVTPRNSSSDNKITTFAYRFRIVCSSAQCTLELLLFKFLPRNEHHGDTDKSWSGMSLVPSNRNHKQSGASWRRRTAQVASCLGARNARIQWTTAIYKSRHRPTPLITLSSTSPNSPLEPDQTGSSLPLGLSLFLLPHLRFS
jgi:hypothetical protein